MSVGPITAPAIAPATAVERTPQSRDLGEAFAKALTEAHAHENNATQQAERFAAGDASVGLHEVMIASEKASIAVRYATTLKNKAVEAYRELMNTQV
jgi:flagellar hook-basal body complex protein FliE